MALTNSTMLALGTPLPDFCLPDTVSGAMMTPAACAGRKGLLVMFLCCHCPYVVHVRDELQRLAADYAGQDIGMLAVSSNDVNEYPDDRPERLSAMARDLGFTFPYCYDERQHTAKAFTAVCTPDFFLFDTDRRLVYRGQLDDSRPGNGKPLTGKDLRGALDAVLRGTPVSREQRPSAGCNIKWKPGNAPDGR